MAVIDTVFPQMVCSASLPDAVAVTTSGESATILVEVTFNSQVILSTNLYAYNYQAELYDIRSLIEDRLHADQLTFADCDISVTEGGSSVGTGGFTVILSEFDKSNIGTWLQSHFLTIRTSQRISAEGQQQLSWFAAQGERITYSIEAIVDNGVSQVVSTWTERAAQNVNKGAYNSLINVPGIMAHFEDTGKVLAFKVSRGANRSMWFYVTDEEPTKSFRFRNQFNALEYAHLYAATTKHHKMEASEAYCLNKIVKYDFERSNEFELQTALLPMEEAQWLEQLLSSRYVECLTKDGSWQEVVVDGESEVSDNAEAENRFSMTYKFVKDVEYQ